MEALPDFRECVTVFKGRAWDARPSPFSPTSNVSNGFVNMIGMAAGAWSGWLTWIGTKYAM